ncbi:MAG TPA: ABC transporter [Verrucomicrobiales bacterium]|nr:ABC transporter [Verrucomicrobiales bacterium]
MSPVLEVTRLGIVRGGTRILDEVTWRVDPGQHWVIVGANGSGKTSLLSALTGYLMPTEGEIAVLGQRYGETDWRELRRRIGWVSSSVRQLMADTEPALFTVASGRYAMIDFWGTPSAKDQRDARRWLDLVEAGALVERPWAVLSQGERQRVLIARALMARPKLLILDEPCAGLDPVAREHFLQFLDRLARQPSAPALVLVTHHVEEITPVFTHALLLRNGRVVAAGPCRQALTSSMLSRVFGSAVRLDHRSGQYRMAVRSRSRQVM